jgi:hypothetical protein
VSFGIDDNPLALPAMIAFYRLPTFAADLALSALLTQILLIWTDGTVKLFLQVLIVDLLVFVQLIRQSRYNLINVVIWEFVLFDLITSID